MFSLNDYREKKNSILNNDRLSQRGKEDALNSLSVLTRNEARAAIKDLRKRAVINALSLSEAQRERDEKIKGAQEKIDYQRLNYEAQKVSSMIKASSSLLDVLEAWEKAKSENDAYVLKAWQDVSKGLISEKYKDDYSGLKGSLFEDMQGLKVELVGVEKTKDELEALDALRSIELEAKEINEAFGSGVSVLSRVFEGVSFEGEKVKLGFDYEVHKLTDRKETKSEVSYRLEREREKAIENHKLALKEKGFENTLDYDFDDMRGFNR